MVHGYDLNVKQEFVIPKNVYLHYKNDVMGVRGEYDISISPLNDYEYKRKYTDITQIWHDSEEEPQGDWKIIILEKYGQFFSYIKEDMEYLYIKHKNKYWKEFVKQEGVVKWAYVTDIFPKDIK